jgi:hypothetical protein
MGVFGLESVIDTYEEDPMAIVEINISMSVDGFVTGPNVQEYPRLGEGGEILHSWLGEDDSKKILRENLFDPAGAVITSRTVFDVTGGWGDDGFTGCRCSC